MDLGPERAAFELERRYERRGHQLGVIGPQSWRGKAYNYPLRTKS